MDKENLYQRLDRKKSGGTNVIVDSRGFSDMVDNLKEKQEKGEKLSLAISGGGAFGVSSYYLAKALINQGIKPNEFVGTSIGGIISTLFSQGYTDEKYIDFIFEGLEKPTPSFLLSKLIPFTIKLTDNERNYLVGNNAEFRRYLEKHTGLYKGIHKNVDILDELVVSTLLNGFFTEKGLQQEERKFQFLTFLDIKKSHNVRLGIQATVVRPKLFKKVPPKVLQTEEEIKEWEEKQGNKNSQIFPPITFRGSYPVLKALLISSHQSLLPNNFTVKGNTLKGIDGYWGGPQGSQAYAHKPSDFNLKSQEGEKVNRVLVHTDDSFALTSTMAPNYGENLDYVIRPNLLKTVSGGAHNFTGKAREVFKEMALEIIE